MTRSQRLLALVLALAIWAIGLGAWILAAEKPTGSIVGRVAEQDGKPIAGARVYLFGEDMPARVAQTAEDGTYRADRLPVGTYRLQARMRGFDAQWREPEETLAENQIVRDADFALMRRAPTVHFAQYQRVYLPSEKLRIGTRGSLVESLALKLYRLDIERLLAARGDLGEANHWGEEGKPAAGDLPPAIPADAVTALATWSAAIPAQSVDEDDWFFRPVEVPRQAEGTYLLVLEAGDGKLHDAFWFNVTRLALVAKRSEDRILVYATDFETRRPVPGVALRAFLGKSSVAGGETGPDGLWQAAVRAESKYLTVIGRAGDSFANVAAYHGHSDRLSVLSYTDRPIYRPGHRVRFKGIVRDLRGAAPAVPHVPAATVWARDPDGAEIGKRTFPLSEAGTYFGEFVLPADGHTGEHSLITEIADERYYTSFKVEAYRKPEFKVDVKPAAPRVVGGASQQVYVTATYFFGAPVAGAKVRYTVFSRPEYPGWTEEDAFYGGFAGGEDLSGGEIVTEGEAVTDDAGKLALAIATRPIAPADAHSRTYDQRYAVEVEGEDQSRRMVKGKASFLVTRGLFDLEAEISTYLVKTGDPVRVRVSAHDYDGRPVQATVSVTLEREQYVPPKAGEESGTTTYEPAGTVRLETGPRGEGVATVKAPRAGSYVVQVKGTDSLGHVIAAQGWFWASAEEAGETESYGSLGVTFDRKTYRPGDIARVLITSPVPDLPLLVTLEGDRIHQARILQLRGSAVRFEIPVLREFEPNIWVDVTAVGGKELLSSGRSLNVMPLDRFLTVSVEPDRETYLPGAPARIRVRAADAAGKPVAGAEISLGVVDEAIYALAPDRTPDLRRFFLGPRSSEVSTFYSFATDYSGGPAKDLGEVRVRKNFQDTAAWFPALVTGGDGTTVAAFDLPDNLTTWVCTARAVTTATQVGATTKNFLATKDLLVRLETPRFFTQGDHLDLLAIVHNFTQRVQKVGVVLDSAGIRLPGSAERSSEIAAGRAYRADFPVAAEEAGTVSIEVKAGNRAVNDAMALVVPVLPHGLPQAKTWAGEVSGEEVISFEVPRTAIPATVRFTLDVSPSPWTAMLAGIGYLQAYPYWCTEQTSSRIVPFAAVYRQLPAYEPLHSVLGADLAAATRKLLGLQHSLGWGWWESGDEEVEMTAHALWGATAARAAGFAVPDHHLERGVDFLAAQVPRLKKDTPRRYFSEAGTGPDTRAVGLRGMWLALGSAPGALEQPGRRLRSVATAELDRLWRDRAGLSSYGKAILAETLLLARDPRAGRALSELDRAVAQSATLAHWEAAGGPFAWGSSDVETTAHAMLAHLGHDPANPLLAKAERWLEVNRRRDRWQSTKDTSAALVAISEFARSRSAGASPAPYGITVTFDGTPIATADADPGPSGRPLRYLLAGERLPPGRHRVALAVSRPDARPLYGAEVRYFERAEEIPARPGEVVQVTREYFGIPRDKLAEARTLGPSQLFEKRFFPKLIPVSRRARTGERLVVRVRVTSTQDVRFAVIEDPLPAGCEILMDESGTPAWWSHRDVLDDKVVFFADTLVKGQPHDFFYVIRPEMAGRLRVLPPVVEAMYAPDIRGSGAGATLEVRD